MTSRNDIVTLAYYAKTLAVVLDGLMTQLEIDANDSKVTLEKDGQDIESKSVSELINDTHKLAHKIMEKS